MAKKYGVVLVVMLLLTVSSVPIAGITSIEPDRSQAAYYDEDEDGDEDENGDGDEYDGNDTALLRQVSDTEEISLHVSFQQPHIREHRVQGETNDRISLLGAPTTGDIGAPLLPRKPVMVLLPQHHDVTSITVAHGDVIRLGDGYTLAHGRMPRPLSGPRPYDGGVPPASTPLSAKTLYGEWIPDEDDIDPSFNPRRPYPTADYTTAGVYTCRGYRILAMVLHPVKYVEATGELSYYPDMTVTVHTHHTGTGQSMCRNQPADQALVEDIVVNPALASSYGAQPRKAPSSSLVDSGQSYDYVIVTSDALLHPTARLGFQDLVEMKQAKGLSATIVTVEEIIEEPAYWDTDPLFNDTAAQIRRFIRDAYQHWGTEYVLLGGDGDAEPYAGDSIIPARKLFTQAGTVPSDLYYACLDGSYNSDGDNRWGETSDGPDGGDVDLIGEVYVGRAPVDTPDEVANFVEKTIQYDSQYHGYLSDVLMAGEYLGFGGIADFGGNYKDEIVNGSNEHGYTTTGIPTSLYNVDTLYDRDWPSFDPDHPWETGWPKQEIISQIENGVHIINHLGHAYYGYDMKLTNNDIAELTNTQPCFIYSQGCDAGGFDNPYGYDAAAEYFTVKTRHGAFAGVWNTRYGYGSPASTDGPSQCFDREFWDAVYGEQKPELGRAHEDSRVDNIWRLTEQQKQRLIRYCLYEVTLFGDPALAIKDPYRPATDVAVTNLTAPRYVQPNNSFDVTVTLTNQGNTSQSDITVDVMINESIYSQATIDTLNSSETTTLTLPCTLPPGVHQLTVNATTPDTPDTIPYNNHQATTVIAESDLIVRQPFDLQPPIYLNTQQQLTYYIINPSAIPAEHVNVTLTQNGQPIDSRQLPSIPAKGSVHLSFNVTFPASQWTTISLHVDSTTIEHILHNNDCNVTVHPVAHTVTVGPAADTDFTTIQAAVYWTGNDDTIHIQPGHYYEDIYLRKLLTITGTSRQTTLVGTMTIFADDVNVNGFTVKDSATAIISYADQSTIHNNSFHHNTYGITMEYGSRHHICNNSIQDGVMGIGVSQSNNNVFSGNRLRNHSAGLVLDRSNGNTIRNNDFYRFGVSAVFYDAEDNEWRHNYWNRPRVLPKPIVGLKRGRRISMPRVQFDWRPARQPNTEHPTSSTVIAKGGFEFNP